MNEIKSGEYVRTNKGIIDKVINNNYYMSDYIECKKGIILRENIKNHSEELVDLITMEDIFKIKEGNIIAYIGFTNSYAEEYADFIEQIKNKEIELLEVLSKEQFSANSYKVGE